MTMKIRYIKIIAFILFVCQSSSFAQTIKEKEKPQPVTRILFVFDASQSMTAMWQNDMKINIARDLLSDLIDSLNGIPNLQLALRMCGHQKNYPPQDCDDTRLEVPFGPDNANKIKHKLKITSPKGTTPIAMSLAAAENDFTYCENCRNIIILITDGLEECSGDPCAVSQSLQKKGIILKPFIIGIGKNMKNKFDCVGTYFDASNEKEFRIALNVAISQALNSTTAQVNLLDIYGNPTETNVNVTFYDNYSGVAKYNFIHTMNNKGVPDTLTIDPLPVYNVVAHTIPPVSIDSVRLTPGKHTIIPLDAPQGYLKLKIDEKAKNIKNLQCIVRKSGDTKTLNVQNFNELEKYIVGKYNIEVLSLPRLYINDVDISQSKTTTIEIPLSGIAVINKSTQGYGSLYVVKDSKMEWIYNLDENNSLETLFLQPGYYKIVFRSKYSTKSQYSVEKSFLIESGATVTVNLYQ